MKNKIFGLIVLILILSSCRGSYLAYQKRNFVPKHESNVKHCMGKNYLGHDVRASMRHYYSKHR